MRIEAFKEYYGATVNGVIRVSPRQPITARGVVIRWDCFNLEYDPDNPKASRFIGLSKKHLFDNYEDANKAVFKIKLTEGGQK